MTPARLIVCLATGLQALAVVGVTGFYVVELSRGQGSDAAGVVSSVVLFALVAGALVGLTLGWWRGAAWPRTATVVWNLVLAPVAFALVQAGQALLGVGLGVIVVVTVVSALAVPRRQGGLPGADETDGTGALL